MVQYWCERKSESWSESEGFEVVQTNGTNCGQRSKEGVYESEMKGRSDSGRPCTRLLDRVKKAYKTRLL